MIQSRRDVYSSSWNIQSIGFKWFINGFECVYRSNESILSSTICIYRHTLTSTRNFSIREFEMCFLSLSWIKVQHWLRIFIAVDYHSNISRHILWLFLGQFQSNDFYQNVCSVGLSQLICRVWHLNQCALLIFIWHNAMKIIEMCTCHL